MLRFGLCVVATTAAAIVVAGSIIVVSFTCVCVCVFAHVPMQSVGEPFGYLSAPRALFRTGCVAPTTTLGVDSSERFVRGAGRSAATDVLLSAIFALTSSVTESARARPCNVLMDFLADSSAPIDDPLADRFREFFPSLGSFVFEFFLPGTRVFELFFFVDCCDGGGAAEDNAPPAGLVGNELRCCCCCRFISSAINTELDPFEGECPLSKLTTFSLDVRSSMACTADKPFCFISRRTALETVSAFCASSNPTLCVFIM